MHLQSPDVATCAVVAVWWTRYRYGSESLDEVLPKHDVTKLIVHALGNIRCTVLHCHVVVTLNWQSSCKAGDDRHIVKL